MRGNVGVALVPSGGIAGVKAAIDLADVGFTVYLLDESTSIEGIMAELDKIFRINGCPLCVIEPKLLGGVEDTRIKRAPKEDLCSRCKIANPFASTAPLNEQRAK